MQVFALGILVIQLAARDGSPELAPLYLGLTGLARAIPGLGLTLIAGAVADRSDRRRLLLVTQGVMSINASLLALVTVLGSVTLWHVLVAAAVQSAAFAFDAPGRHSMLPRLVPPRAIASAVGLQSAAFNGAQVIGPLAGALVGSFALMHLGRSRYVGRIYAGSALFNGLAVVFFALSLQPAYALVTAFAAGLAGTLMVGLTNTMLQGAITDEYRGRIMSIFSFMFIGLMPAGQLVLGAIGTPRGVLAALIAAGSVAYAVGLFGMVRVPVVLALP